MTPLSGSGFMGLIFVFVLCAFFRLRHVFHLVVLLCSVPFCFGLHDSLVWFGFLGVDFLLFYTRFSPGFSVLFCSIMLYFGLSFVFAFSFNE